MSFIWRLASAFRFFCYDTPGRQSVSFPSVQRFLFLSGKRILVFTSERGGRHVIKEYTPRPASCSGYKLGPIPHISKSIEAASVATGAGWKMDIWDVYSFYIFS